MQYRALGNTGLKVSKLGLGALHLQSASIDEVEEILDIALDGGVNYIDTARVYGDSEDKLGQLLGKRRKDIVLSSKVISRQLNVFKADLQTSLKKLRTDYLDILFIHDVSTKDGYSTVMNQGVYEYVKDMKDQGTIGHIGISTHDDELAEDMITSGAFEIIMLAYNAANPAAGKKLIPLAKENDLGVIIMKPFGGGVLCDEGTEHTNIQVSTQEALHFALSNPYISTVIPGVDRVEYMKKDLDIAKLPPMSEQKQKELIKRASSLGSDFCRQCGYCRPCPQGLDIPALMKIYSHWPVYSQTNWAMAHLLRKRYAEITPSASHCIACQECEEKCPYDLPICSSIRELVEKLG